MPTCNTAVNGTDILLCVDVGGMLTIVGSQRSVSFAETSEQIDVSSKESRAMRVKAGRYSSTVTLEHLYVPDDAAYLALRDANRNGDCIFICRNEFGNDFEQAAAIVTSLSGEFPDQAEAVISVELMVDGEWELVV